MVASHTRSHFTERLHPSRRGCWTHSFPRLAGNEEGLPGDSCLDRQWGIQFQLNVNLSPRQFADGDLLGGVLNILHGEDLDPNLRTLEPTESAYLAQQETIKAVLEHALCWDRHLVG